jgi:uncharacterized membrane protein YeaQ/YmgE (transglycosylase-associated protein family)
MNFATWVLAGGFLGWFAYSFLDFNRARGAILSTMIGALGGVVGGEMIAPLFGGAGMAAHDFSSLALVSCAAAAAALLIFSNLVHAIWRV